MPWALSQGVRFVVFLVDGAGRCRASREYCAGRSSLPIYLVILVHAGRASRCSAWSRGGSQRWLDLGFIRLQPSELMKPAIVLACARFYDHAAGRRDAQLARDLAGRGC